MTILAAAYARLSKEDINKQGEVDSTSIINQNSLIDEFVKAQGWEIYDHYIDDDYSGSDRDRPDFNRIISDAFAGKFQVIVSKTQSRFLRDIELVEHYIHGVFLEKNIRYIAILDNIDTENMNSGSKKVSQINGLKDTWYLEDLSHNVRASFKTMTKNGKFIGSWATYGYMKDPEDKNHLVIDPEAAETIKRIFRLYTSGTGISKIAKIFNDEGLPNPLLYKRQRGEKIGADSRKTTKCYLWSAYTISSILSNEVYIGNMIQGKMKKVSYKSKKLVRVPEEQWVRKNNTHEAIIEAEIWEAAQKQKGCRGRASITGNYNIFLGKVRCLECGERMQMISYPAFENGVKSKTKYYHMFKCSRRIIHPASCDSNGLSQRKLEKYILQELNILADMYFDQSAIESQVKLSDARAEQLAAATKRISDIEKQIQDADNAIMTLYIDKARGIISEEQFLQINEKLSAENENARNVIEKLQEDAAALQKESAKKKTLKEVVTRYRNLSSLDYEIIQELIDMIYIGKKADGKRTIKIVWNF